MRRFFQCLLYPIATTVKCILWAYQWLCTLPLFVSCAMATALLWKKIVVSICYSVVCTYTIQREVKLHSCPGYKTRFYFCWSRDMFYSSLQRTTQSLTLEKRCSTQQLLLLKEYKHSENQQTIKLHTYTKPVLEWNLLLLYLNATQLP